MLKLKKTRLKIMQVYAFTSIYRGEDIKTVYEEITLALEKR